MSYAPSTFHAGTGEYFFLKEGFLTGMSPLITARYTIPAFDDYEATNLTITNSSAKAGTGTATSWSGWNLDAAKTKLLALAYIAPSTTDWAGIGFHEGTLPTGALDESYQAIFYGNQARIAMSEYTGGSITDIDTTSTIYQDDVISSPVWGIALYVDGDSNLQKCFIKSGTAEWAEVLSDTDSDHTSFQSFFLWHDEASVRFITPIMCWGS